MTLSNPTTTTPDLAIAAVYCPCCSALTELAVQQDFRAGHENTFYTIATCPQPQSVCPIGHATASVRRIENGEFTAQWKVEARFDWRTGEAL
jgi:hypothetical protein